MICQQTMRECDKDGCAMWRMGDCPSLMPEPHECPVIVIEPFVLDTETLELVRTLH